MIRVKIDILKFTGAKTVTAKDGLEYIAIPVKGNFHVGAKGTYCDLTLMDNRDGRDKYDNDGFCTVDVGKERRLAGEKGPILGNWKNLDGGNPQGGRDVPASEAVRRQPAGQVAATQPDDETDDIPF